MFLDLNIASQKDSSGVDPQDLCHNSKILRLSQQ